MGLEYTKIPLFLQTVRTSGAENNPLYSSNNEQRILNNIIIQAFYKYSSLKSSPKYSSSEGLFFVPKPL